MKRMDKNLLDYLTEGLKWSGIVTGGYFSLLFASGIFGKMPWYTRINSQEELEYVVAEECKKLGLNKKEIDVFYDKYNVNCAGKRDGRLSLNISSFLRPTKHAVRHELCHLVKDCDKFEKFIKDNKRTMKGWLYYLFVAEPRAELYATFGIKL